MLSEITLQYPSNWTIPPLQIEGVKQTFILDSGSCRSILQPGASDELTGCTDLAPFGECTKIGFIGIKEKTNKLGGIEKSSSENQFLIPRVKFSS